VGSAGVNGIYDTLVFEPFVLKYKESFPGYTKPTEASLAKIRPGAVLRIRQKERLDFSEGWRKALVHLRPEVVRDYSVKEDLELPGEGDPTSFFVDEPPDQKNYLLKIEALVRGLAEERYGIDSYTLRVEDWMCECVVDEIYHTDEERPFQPPYYQLVGDVNSNLGVCDDTTLFDPQDVEAIAYLPGFEVE
jgi:hypothetical protein